MVDISRGEAVALIVVEDNPHDVEFMLRAFRGHQLASQIVILRDGAEAVDFLFPPPAAGAPIRPGLPRLILLDLKLPKVDGIEVLRRIKSEERTRLIPVVVLTSSNEDGDIRACYQLGANSYVVKPVGFGEFLKRVVDVGEYWLCSNTPPR